MVSYEPQYRIPDPGLHLARIVDVIDLGIVQTRYGPKETLRLVWRIEENGVTYDVWHTVKKSLHPKATLHRIVATVTGQARTRMDVSMLKSAPAAYIKIEHSPVKDDGRTYPNVAAVYSPREFATIQAAEVITAMDEAEGSR